MTGIRNSQNAFIHSHTQTYKHTQCKQSVMLCITRHTGISSNNVSQVTRTYKLDKHTEIYIHTHIQSHTHTHTQTKTYTNTSGSHNLPDTFSKLTKDLIQTSTLTTFILSLVNLNIMALQGFLGKGASMVHWASPRLV